MQAKKWYTNRISIEEIQQAAKTAYDITLRRSDVLELLENTEEFAREFECLDKSDIIDIIISPFQPSWERKHASTI